jgi:hypothetical protein
MKKSSFTMLIAVLFLMKGLAQQVQEQQHTLVTKRTADWCPYCGTWGWTYFENAIEQNGDKAIYMAAHYDGGLYDPAAKEITDNWGGFYQPKFFVNEKEQGVTSGNVTAKLASLNIQLDSLANLAPVANCGFDPVFSNGELKVDAKTKFFQTTDGEFYLGIYLLEDHVTAYQASIGANAVHRHLFRKSFTAETFGMPLANGNVAAGQEYLLSFSTPVAEITGHEYEVIGIIWRKDGDKYIPVNVWSNNQIETVSAVDDPNLQNRMVVYPSVAKEKVTIQIESIDNQSVAQLEVFDANGRKVATLLKGQLSAGATSFQLDKKELGGNGLYILRLQTPDFVKTGKLVFVD